jgi:hypothetical protein
VATREQIDALWELVKASERLGVVGARLHDASTVAEFTSAFQERQRLLGVVLEMIGEKHV